MLPAYLLSTYLRPPPCVCSLAPFPPSIYKPQRNLLAPASKISKNSNQERTKNLPAWHAPPKSCQKPVNYTPLPICCLSCPLHPPLTGARPHGAVALGTLASILFVTACSSLVQRSNPALRGLCPSRLSRARLARVILRFAAPILAATTHPPSRLRARFQGSVRPLVVVVIVVAVAVVTAAAHARRLLPTVEARAKPIPRPPASQSACAAPCHVRHGHATPRLVCGAD